MPTAGADSRGGHGAVIMVDVRAKGRWRRAESLRRDVALRGSVGAGGWRRLRPLNTNGAAVDRGTLHREPRTAISSQETPHFHQCEYFRGTTGSVTEEATLGPAA